MSRLKWLPMRDKYKIFEDSITEFYKLKEKKHLEIIGLARSGQKESGEGKLDDP